MSLTTHLKTNEHILKYIQKKKISETFLEFLEESFFNGIIPEDQPSLTVIGGSPGAGKTTFRKSCQWDNCHIHDMDEVLITIPGYQKDLEEFGPIDAFNNWWPVAQKITNVMFEYAILEKYNIVYDRTCGTADSFFAIKQAKQEHDYHIVLHGLYVPEDIAQARVSHRLETEGRAVTPDIVTEYGKRFSALWPYYLEFIDDAKLHNGENLNNLFFSSEAGILDEATYRNFLSMGDAHPIVNEVTSNFDTSNLQSAL